MADELLNSQNIDERIARLQKIRSNLIGAVKAVNLFIPEAQQSKNEVVMLTRELEKFKEDKKPCVKKCEG